MKNLFQLTKIAREKAHQWVQGDKGAAQESHPQKPIESFEGVKPFPEEALLEAFNKASRIIEQENHLLQNDAPVEAMGLLPRKTAAIENLHSLIESVHNLQVSPGGLPESIKVAQTHFTSLIERNDELLKNSLHTQSIVMKILVDAAARAAQQSYNHSGNMVTDASQTSVTVDNKI